jgi:CDP-glycerol glycerophosphotransferase (TagB/SpsB family)
LKNLKKKTIFSMSNKTQNQIISIQNTHRGFKILGLVFLPQTQEIQSIKIGNKTYTIKSIIRFNLSQKTKMLLYSTLIEYKGITDLGLNNQFTFSTKEQDIPMSFFLFLKRGLLIRGKVHNINNSKMSAYIRQGEGNMITLTVRESNVTDKPSQRLKIFFAFLLSFIWKLRKIHLLYEKLGDKYEESASVLYEKLIDLGYNNSYFLLSKKAREHFDIDEKYKKNLIEEHTFKHYLYFFSAKTFLGTESLPSAFEIRTVSKLAMVYMRYSKYYNFVFLQHGVMYAVALESETREGFRYGNWFQKSTKIVVSSEAEAQHFITQGNYPRESLYLTGLPKFDRSTLNEDADQITIMPTWRNWEYVEMNNDPTKTTYYKMLLDIYNNVPNELKPKTSILLHPSFRGKLKGTPLESMIKEEYNYNRILQKTKLLITDFSSISFDAFFRGSNVIFWWKDKDMTMLKYQGKLMLTEENIFGDIFKAGDSLAELIQNNYSNKQPEQYKEKFSKLIDFSDRENTNRLVEKLKIDGYLYK